MLRKIGLFTVLAIGLAFAQDSLRLEGVPSWGQEWPYNMFCPGDTNLNINSKYHGHAPTGCASTAIAQIMRYYRYPDYGQGSVSYTTTDFGPVGMKFDTCTFDWARMPLSLDTTNPLNEQQSVARLLQGVGLSIQTTYGITASSAFDTEMELGIGYNLKYSANIMWKKQNEYTGSAWDSVLVHELRSGRPILYSASPSEQEGHLFVIDGYRTVDNVLRYHFNIGWNGSSDGYYRLDSLDMENYFFNKMHKAAIPFIPATLPAPEQFRIQRISTYLGFTWKPVVNSNLNGYHMIRRANNAIGTYYLDASDTSVFVFDYKDTASIKAFFPDGVSQLEFAIFALNRDSTASCYSDFITITREEFFAATRLVMAQQDKKSVKLLSVFTRIDGIHLRLSSTFNGAGEITLYLPNGKIVGAVHLSSLSFASSREIIIPTKGLARTCLILRLKAGDGSIITRTVAALTY
jgi:hypothetical protein